MDVHIGIGAKERKRMAQDLNLLLANEYVLYTKTLKHHWNIEGPCFGQLHKLFQDQYEALLTIADDVAERARALGFFSFGTLSEFVKNTTLKEYPGKNEKELEMVRLLLVDHEAIIQQIRTLIDTSANMHDMGTNNFLCDLIEKHEKMAWMLRAHLAK
ncbi:MAG TPA: DNA starvation/stationary phase protection protein [Candidatus Bathyarchaeia archaeon]|nr:DNA starvation/stationary phase protection protein [Candidatus Bathyarchaeia archaeon]